MGEPVEGQVVMFVGTFEHSLDETDRAEAEALLFDPAPRHDPAPTVTIPRASTAGAAPRQL